MVYSSPPLHLPITPRTSSASTLPGSGSSLGMGASSVPNLIPPQASESKRDRKRRETINKIEILHNESWNNRDEKFSALYKEYHNENKAINSQPPTSTKYMLRLYPLTVERDALLESADYEYNYKVGLARKMYESERDAIEGQYWDARDQVRQRLLGAIEDRRRKLREEKEGGDVVSETLLEAATRPRPTRRLPGRARADLKGLSPNAAHPLRMTETTIGLNPVTPPDGTKPTDLLLHSLLAPTLAQINVDDILSPNPSSLVVLPPPTGQLAYTATQGKRGGPRGKPGDKEEAIVPAPGTGTALAIASGQALGSTTGNGVAGGGKRSRGAGAAQGWVLGKALADMKKMESATQLEIDSDWARIQGPQGRGRRARGD